MLHATNDLVSLTLARTIAAQLPDHPEWIDLARGNLLRWKARSSTGERGSPATYDEWLAILDRPINEVIAIYTEESHEGQRIRQSSPFAGALSAQEVWAIKERCRHGSF